jgi:hypothetical protein
MRVASFCNRCTNSEAMPKQLSRTLTMIAAVLGAAAAIVLVSRIALTMDALTSWEVRVAYAACITAIIAAAVLVLRRLLQPAAGAKGEGRGSRRGSSQARLDRLVARHGLDRVGHEASPIRRQRGEPRRVAVVGIGRTGKSRVIAALRQTLAAAASPPVELVEIESLGIDFATNLARLAPALAADAVVFVADQDLRAYEFAALQALSERGLAPILVINKSDQRDATARAETRASVQRRLAGLINPADIVETSAEPAPVVRIAVDAEGRSSEEEMSRPADVTAAAERLLARLT